MALNSPSPRLSSCPWLEPPRPRKSPVPEAAAAPHEVGALHKDVKTSHQPGTSWVMRGTTRMILFNIHQDLSNLYSTEEYE